MKLERLEIRELAGLRTPLVLENLGAPLVAILGPNASGKSSLVRALRALLWPASTPARCYASARVRIGERAWIVERLGHTSEWRPLEGAPAAPPSLPPRELADCWLIGLETLAAASAGERGFAREVRKQLNGGFDLEALRSAFEVRAQASRAEAEQLKKAQLALHTARGEHERLEEERAQLGALGERVPAAESAVQHAQAARLAQPVLAARAEIARLERELELFPPGLDKLRGGELELHEQAQRELEQRSLERVRATLDLQRARDAAELRELRALEPARAAAALEQQATQLAALRMRALQLEHLERDLLQAEASAGSPVAAPELAAAELAELEQRLRAARSLEPRIDLLRAQLAPRDEATDEVAQAAGPGARTRAPIVIVLALAAALSALAIVFVESFALRLALAVVAGSAGTAAALLLLRSRAAPTERDERSTRPADGTAGALARLEAERTRELERATELAAALGLARGGSGLELEALTHELGERARLRVQSESAQQSARQLRARWIEALALFATDLAQAEARADRAVEELRDAAACSAALGAAEERARARARAWSAVGKAEESAQRARIEEEHARSALEAQLADWGWSELEPAERVRRAELAPQRARLENELRERRAAERGGLATLLARGEHAAELLELPEAQLEERARAAPELAQRRDELHAQRARLELRIEQASTGHALEEALARVESARLALEARRLELLEQRAVHWLLARVSDAQERETAPAVLREARRLVRAFTRDSIELCVDARGELEARELASGELRALDELSSGTRAQLLLAARIAFAAEQERGEPLPLVFDEALATSDPARFEAVAQALFELARGGRQLVFLSSDPSELARLRAALGGELHCIDLAALRGEQAAVAPAELALESAQRVPEPGALGAEAYARVLGVEALDPWATPASAHVFHVASGELALLHALVQRGLERVGQLESWFERGGALTQFDTARIASLRARARAFARCVELWRSGRARPLLRGELDEVLPNGSKLAAPLWEALRASHGDVQRLLDPDTAREVKGFGPARSAELRAQLEERGWLPRGERKDEAAIARELALELEASGNFAALGPDELRAWTRLWCAACELGEARRRRELYDSAPADPRAGVAQASARNAESERQA